jgi:hypothetical protein
MRNSGLCPLVDPAPLPLGSPWLVGGLDLTNSFPLKYDTFRLVLTCRNLYRRATNHYLRTCGPPSPVHLLFHPASVHPLVAIPFRDAPAFWLISRRGSHISIFALRPLTLVHLPIPKLSPFKSHSTTRFQQASSTNYGVRGRLPYPKHACHPTFVSVLTRVILLASHIPEHPQQVHYLFFELFQRRARVNRCHHSFDHHPRSTSLHRVPQVCLMRTRPLHRPEGEVTDEKGGGVRRPRDLRARKLMGRDNQRVMRNVARQTKQGERRTIRARHRQPVD